MQKLTDLNHTLLTKSVVKTLTLNDITTILQFLQHDTGKLTTLTKLKLFEILEIRNAIFNKYAAPVFDGSTLFSLNKKRFLDTGIESLNAVLDGGIPIGYITELCGLASSGKTQLCYQLAINCTVNTENTVLYVDTKGDFSSLRIQAILDNIGFSHQEIAKNMLKIKVLHVWTMEEITDVFRKLKNKSIIIPNLSLIIIDSLPCLLLQHFGDENKIGLTYLNVFVNYCRFLCKNNEISIICVNIQTRWVEQEPLEFEEEDQSKEISYIEKHNRCLGKYWQHIPAIVLLMEKCIRDLLTTTSYNNDKNSFAVKICMIRSNNTKLEQQCILHVNNTGVR